MVKKINIFRKNRNDTEILNDRGFTLIEIMIVIAIIAIMAAYGIPAYMTRVDRARGMEAAAYFKDINESLKAYESAKGITYPSAGGVMADETRLAKALGLDFADSHNFAFAIFQGGATCIQIAAVAITSQASAAIGSVTAYTDRTTTPDPWTTTKNADITGAAVVFQSPMPAASDANSEAGWEASMNLGFFLGTLPATPFGTCVS